LDISRDALRYKLKKFGLIRAEDEGARLWRRSSDSESLAGKIPRPSKESAELRDHASEKPIGAVR